MVASGNMNIDWPRKLVLHNTSYRVTSSTLLYRNHRSASPEEEPDKEPDNKGSKEEERKQPLAVIPYVSAMSEQIRKACEKFDLRVESSNQAQLSAHYSPKWRIPPQEETSRCGLPRIPCQCSKVYVGATRDASQRTQGCMQQGGTHGSLPLPSINGTSNMKWIGTKLRCWIELPDVSSWR